MKRMFLLLLCLGFAHCANAAVLFYKNVLTVTITGGGRVMNHTFGGFTLIDSSNGNVAFISADIKSKRFKVEQPDHDLNTVQPSANGTRTVLGIRSGNGEGLNAKGANVALNVGSTQPVLAPNAMVVGGCEAYTPPGLMSAYLFEYHGSLVYDKLDTVTATKANADLAAAIEQARQILTSKGFTEE